MLRSRLIAIRRTLYARIPAEAARRLGLRPGQPVEVDIRPLGAAPGSEWSSFCNFNI